MSKYDIQINGNTADHYDLEDAARVGKVYQVGDSAFEHARKKLKALGDRGSKCRMTDAREARDSIERGIQQMLKACENVASVADPASASISSWGFFPSNKLKG